MNSHETGVCSIDGCGRPVRSLGWCDPHYQRWLRLGDVVADQPITTKSAVRYDCSVEDCDRRATRRGWCNTHYERWRLTGSARADEPVGKSVGDDAAYRTVHTRLDKAFGKATERLCVDCLQRAAQWSYTGGDPDEKRSPVGIPYSTDPARYVPRCVDCHCRFDKHYGENHRSAKLTDDQVAELREASMAGQSSVSLGAQFGISQTHAWNIANGRSRATS